MNFWNRLVLGRVGISISTAGALGLFVAGCASNPAPAPALPPPPTASVEAIPGATVLTQDQMTKLCNAAPSSCQRVQLGQPLTEDDVVMMAHLGFPVDTIINELKVSRSVYHLTAGDIITLKNSGLSDPVINYMLTTPGAIAEVAPATPTTTVAPVAVAQVPPPAPPVETPPPTPGPDYVWVGGDWVWNGGWVWVGGRWAIPPYAGAVWFHGGWHRGWYGGRGGYRYRRDHWR